MDCEFLGFFSADEKTRIRAALRRLHGPRLFGMPPHWTVTNTTHRGGRQYMAVSCRSSPTGRPSSFHGETTSELIEAIHARVSGTAE